MTTTLTTSVLVGDDPLERLRARLCALESTHVLLREALRRALPYVEQCRPHTVSEPLCDSDGCIACRETRAWQTALRLAKQALGEGET